MRRGKTLALALCLPLVASRAAERKPVFDAPADVAAIRAAETFLATEIDMNKVIGAYADDATVLDIYAPGIFKGRDQILAGFAPQMAVIRSMDHSIPELTIATDGEIGCAASQIAFDTTLKDGKRFRFNVRQLDAYRKIAGRWKIIQQHVAVPLDPKTLAALTDAPIRPRRLTWSEHPVEAPSTTPDQARREIAKWLDIGAASTGIDMLMGYYGPGDDILVYDSLHPRALIGRQEVRDFYRGIMGSYSAIKVSMPNLAIVSDGSLGAQIDTQDITLVMKDGTKRALALRQSDCMRRVKGKWYSFLEMLSYPVDRATGRGVMTGPGAALEPRRPAFR